MRPAYFLSIDKRSVGGTRVFNGNLPAACVYDAGVKARGFGVSGKRNARLRVASNAHAGAKRENGSGVRAGRCDKTSPAPAG